MAITNYHSNVGDEDEDHPCKYIMNNTINFDKNRRFQAQKTITKASQKLGEPLSECHLSNDPALSADFDHILCTFCIRHGSGSSCLPKVRHWTQRSHQSFPVESELPQVGKFWSNRQGA